MSVLFALVYNVGVDINGVSNLVLHVHLKTGGEIFQEFKDTHVSNVIERNIPFTFGIEVTTVQCLE